MNAVRILVLVLAVAAAAAAAYAVNAYLSSQSQAPVAAGPVEQKPVVRVLTAGKDLPLGHIIDRGDLRWQAWPEEALSGRFLNERDHPDAMNKIAGRRVKAKIVEGEPIIESKLVPAGEGGVLAALVTPGSRAVAARISPEKGAGGFILPGDRVDILLTRNLEDEVGRNYTDTRTILQNIRVLAIDQDTAEKEGAQTLLGKTITLELAPEQAEVLAQAESAGQLTFALRALGDSTAVAFNRNDPDADQSADRKGRTVTVYRAGTPSRTSVGGRTQ